MAKIRFVSIVLLIAIMTAALFPQQSKATDWAYRFVVWNDTIYVVSEEYVTDVEEEIGQVTHYSDQNQTGGNFSNAYPKGTKYYAIQEVERKEAIAVQQEDHTYIKAYSNGAYEYKPRDSHFLLPMGFALLFIMIIGIIFFGTRVKS